MAFHVENLKFIIERAKERGATVVRDIWEESDKFGTVRFATLHIVNEDELLDPRVGTIPINLIFPLFFLVWRRNAYTYRTKQLQGHIFAQLQTISRT